MEEKFIEPYHPEQNPLERKILHCKSDCNKIMIDKFFDPQGWFKGMDYIVDLYNHEAHPGNNDYLHPII